MFRSRVAHPPGPEIEPPLKQALEAQMGHPVVREESLRALRRFEARQQLAVDALATTSGARMRPGLTTTDLNRILVAAAKGSVVLRHGDVASVRTDVPFAGGRWSTYAIAHHAVVEQSVLRPSPGRPD